MSKQKKSKKNTIALLRRFIPYYKPYRGIFYFDTLCAAFTTSSDLVLPLLVRSLVDTAKTNTADLTAKYIWTIGGIYIGLKFLDAIARYFMASVGHIMGAKMETDMRTDLFEHLQKLSFDFYDNTKIGQIMARMTSDLFDVTEFAHHGPENTFIALLEIIVAFGVLMSINIPLTLIIFATIPVMLFVVLKFNGILKKQFKAQRVQVGEINSQLEDSLLGIRVVKSFTNEDIEKEKFELGNQKFLDIKKKSYYVLGGYHGTTKFFDGIMYVVVLILGAFYMKDGKITPGDFFAYMLYVSTLLGAIRILIEFTEQFMRGLTGIERFFELMDAPVEIFDKEDAVEMTNIKGDIEFKDVGFAYKDDGKTVLEKINLHIEPGQNVAIVGPSGGGKTTMCNLIPRFYEATSGEILIDGNNIKDVTLKSLRQHIGFVQQEVYLFSGTVLENIMYGKPGATREEAIEAAKLAGAHEFISELSNGYDTYVGERGLKLSGGQKQRISIARVFLKNPPVLILDEATSALDNESERLVQQSLERLASGRTTLTIAHRLTTIKNAEQIVVLTENGIEEKGSHKELLEKKGLYYNLYQSYGDVNDSL